MNPTIDILVPTTGRADKLAAVAANIHEATTVEHRVVFIVEAEDRASLFAIHDAQRGGDFAQVNQHEPNYAGAILTGYEVTDAPFLFTAADDLRFHLGWDLAAVDVMRRRGVQVVGTNDQCNPYVAAGIHATHYLVDRRYLDEVGGVIDGGPGSFLNTAYDHQFTDSEFIGTARHRGVFAPCLSSVVEHLHWSTGKSEADETTAKTVARYDEDEALFRSRRHLWGFTDCHEGDAA